MVDKRDILVLKTKDGTEEEVELILTANIDKKKYLLYKNKQNEIFASYILHNGDTLYNDLTDEEYNMLENLYRKGNEVYDK